MGPHFIEYCIQYFQIKLEKLYNRGILYYLHNPAYSFTRDPWDEKAKDKSCEFNKEWLSDQGSDYKCITQEDYG